MKPKLNNYVDDNPCSSLPTSTSEPLVQLRYLLLYKPFQYLTSPHSTCTDIKPPIFFLFSNHSVEITDEWKLFIRFYWFFIDSVAIDFTKYQYWILSHGKKCEILPKSLKQNTKQLDKISYRKVNITIFFGLLTIFYFICS